MANKRKNEILNILQGVGILDPEITLTNKGHYQIKSPKLKRLIFTASTPSDSRGDLNLKSEVRREIIGSLVGKSATAYNEAEIKEVLEYYDKHGISKTNEHFKISPRTLRTWRAKAGESIARSSSHIKPAIKNEVLKRFVNGEKIAHIMRDYPKIPAKTAYSWTDYYKKFGYYPETKTPQKDITKKDIARDTSYMKSGQKPLVNNEFQSAIELLSTLCEKNRELLAKNEALTVQNDELKAKLQIVSEAISL